MTRIGFVGLGRMGRAMAPHLAADGWQVTGHDLVRPDPLPANVGFSERLEDLAGSDVIITMLPDGAAVRAVVDHLLDDGCTASVIDMSSSHPDDSRALAARLAERGLSFVDAPVSGGVSRAEAAGLMIMAGGTDAAVAAAMPVLASMGRPVHLGPAGCGHAMKALNNYVSAAGLIAAFEALATARAAGIAPDRFLEVINAATGRNNTTEVKIDRFVLDESYDSGFALALMEKDVSIAATLMAAVTRQGPLAGAVLAQLRDGLARLGADADHTEIYRAVTRDDGV
ncbi:MAG: NAD(P)-dependent oxidoreductase [Pseudomonadota bacterium]|nr:NAD(P)-dependent oxidoreductase [Pseudomonadota bacterium]